MNSATNPSIQQSLRSAEERARKGVEWVPDSPAYLANPYPTYQKLRERDPVHWSASTNQFVLTRYGDIDRVLRDDVNFSKDFTKGDVRKRAVFARSQVPRSVLTMDPPDHMRVRRLVNRAFTPRAVAQMEEYIRSTAHELLDRVEDASEFDLMAALAGPLPCIVITRMIGVPEQDVDRFMQWQRRTLRILEPTLPDGELARILEAERNFSDYLADIIEQRREEPRDDLVTGLVQAEDAGDKLTPAETRATLRLLLVAGNATTTGLIGNGMRALLLHGEQLELLRSQPQLMGNALEELLRYDAPLQLDPRFTATNLEIGGRRIASDSRITCVLGAANRDPELFERPDELDITRSSKAHLSFGRGIHYCLGAALARLEGRIAFEVLLERYSDIRFGAREPQYGNSAALRGLEHLDIRVRRTARATASRGSTGLPQLPSTN